MRYYLLVFGMVAALASRALSQTAVAVTYDTCGYLALWEDVRPSSFEEAQQQYDSLRLYIELCANKDDYSWRAFLHLDGAVQRLSTDPARFDAYRAWLISVLYLNKSNPEYFCVCVGSMAGTYQESRFDPLGYLAVLNYLRNNHKECWGPADSAEYAKDSAYDYQHGHDPSHLPSLDSMGLGFLLSENVVSPSEQLPSQIRISFTGSPNPFKQETILSFDLNRMTYTTVAIYDDLGRMVWGDGKGHSLDAGPHAIRIDGSTLPTGTLYARISTGFGEVRTVKLVHE